MRIFLMASLVFYSINASAQSIPAITGSSFKASEAKIFLDHHNKVRASERPEGKWLGIIPKWFGAVPVRWGQVSHTAQVAPSLW